jgi:chemotaxis protein CheY-P-specific phosphatase CheC
LHGPGELHRLDQQRSFAVLLDIFGPLGGTIAVILPERDAHLLLELLLGEETQAALPLSELAASTIQEVANIMASACLNTLAPRLESILLPSIPRMLVGSTKDLVSEAVQALPGATVAIETRFSISAPPCHGSLFLIPAPSLLEAAQNRS